MTTLPVHRSTRTGAIATSAAIFALFACSAPSGIDDTPVAGVAAAASGEPSGVLDGIEEARLHLANEALEDAWDELFLVRIQLEESLDESPVIQSKVGIANIRERLKIEGPAAALAELDSIAPQLALLESLEGAEGARGQLDEARAFLEQAGALLEHARETGARIATTEGSPIAEPSHG